MIQTRGMSLLCSILAVNPLKILNSFEEYSEILLNFQGAALETINILIAENIVNRPTEINSDSVSSLINYICYFLENPTLVEKVSVEQSIDSFTQMFVKSISLLLAEKPVDFCFKERIRTLAATKDLSFIMEIGDNEDLYDRIVQNQKPCVSYLISCLIDDNKTISDYAANILIKLIQKEKSITNYLLDYAAFLSSEKRSSSNIRVRELLGQTTSGDVKGSAVNSIYNSILEPVIVNTQMFSHVEPEEVPMLMKKAKPRRKDYNSERSFLKKAELQFPEALIIKRKNTIMNDKSDLPICQMLKKLGKLYWQDRWFEFYPRSGCLLWRSKSDDPEVKGVLIVDHTYSIEQVKDNNKFILALTPKAGKKYLMQFPSQADLNNWVVLFGNALTYSAA